MQQVFGVTYEILNHVSYYYVYTQVYFVFVLKGTIEIPFLSC